MKPTENKNIEHHSVQLGNITHHWKTQLGFQGFDANRFCRGFEEFLTGGKVKESPGERRYNKIVDKIKSRIRVRNIILNIIIKIAITLIQAPICIIISALPVHLTGIPELGYITGIFGGAGICMIGLLTIEADVLKTNTDYITFKHKNKVHGK